MANVVILGVQWGDEGKGKIVDLLCAAFDVVARYQGGHNAGHTVKFGEKHFALRLIPSGILHPDKLCVLGNGMVVEPEASRRARELCARRGVRVVGLHLRRAHVLLPRPQGARPGARGSGGRARSAPPGAASARPTRQGARDGLRSATSSARPRERWRLCVRTSRAHGARHAEPALAGSSPTNTALAERLEPSDARHGTCCTVLCRPRKTRCCSRARRGRCSTSTTARIRSSPSSNTTVGGVCTGTRRPAAPHRPRRSASSRRTRRASAAARSRPSSDDARRAPAQRGNEFGTVTGRPRRCGWFDRSRRAPPRASTASTRRADQARRARRVRRDPGLHGYYPPGHEREGADARLPLRPAVA